MSLAENLKTTLYQTFDLALNLEKVGSMIFPNKIGAKGKKRLISISKEIKTLENFIKSNPKLLQKQERVQKTPNSKNSTIQKDIVSDCPGSVAKKRLSLSIKEINQRVRLSRAGKRSVGKYIADNDNYSPVRNLNDTFDSSVQYKTHTTKNFPSDFNDEKPQPYVSLTSGQIEDPITLPSFNQFLGLKTEQDIVGKGKEELFNRIQRATEQIDKLKDALDYNLLHNPTEDKKILNKKPFGLFSKRLEAKDLLSSRKNKKNELRTMMNQYYTMPNHYQSPESHTKTKKNPTRSTTSNGTIESSLGESIRSLYRSKAIENKKLTDILTKISLDRPYSIQQKLELIQKDKEKYKNKHHSIEKFNSFRNIIEQKKRDKQYKNYEQGLAYLETLHNYKFHKHEPSNCELLVLELWRKMVEAGTVITRQEFNNIVSIITPEEAGIKEIQTLIQKFSDIC
jgi:hypothetical protein